MDINKLTPEQREALKERFNYYIDTAKFGIERQSDSANSIDAKTDILLASLGGLIALSIGLFLNSNDSFQGFTDLPLVYQYLTIIFVIAYVISLLVNFVYGYLTIRNRDFAIGLSVQTLRNLEEYNLSNTVLLKKISDNLERSYTHNASFIEDKYKYFNITRILWLINFLLTIIFILLIKLS